MIGPIERIHSGAEEQFLVWMGGVVAAREGYPMGSLRL